MRFHSNLGRDGAIINGLKARITLGIRGLEAHLNNISGVYINIGLGLCTLAIVALENVTATSCYKKTWKKGEKQK